MLYYMPTNINFGQGCLSNLKDILKLKQPGNIVVFTGKISAKRSGVLKKLLKYTNGYNVYVHDKVLPNPSKDSLKDGIKLCRLKKAEFIISVGGGSAIDYGKAVSVLCKEKGKVEFVAIPTTFGTSSEITPYAVMTDERAGIKVTLSNDLMFPNHAFVDPAYSLSMPRELIAASLADLLSHALEAYWSRRASQLTDSFATSAIEIFLNNYHDTFRSPSDLEARSKMSLSSLFAGLAFSNTKTTACHAISYPMTVIYGIPHGIACALTLGEIFELNWRHSRSKMSSLCGILGCRNADESRAKIEKILTDVGISIRLRDYGISRKDIGIIVLKGFNPEKMRNNPAKVTKRRLGEMLKRIY